MTIRELYFSLKNQNSKYLNETVICEILLFCCKFDSKTELFSNFDKEIGIDLTDITKRILEGEPYQYVLHNASFLGHNFYVDENVLIPRQETEQLVLDLDKLIKEKYKDNKIEIIDLCCGSGVIGISLTMLNKNLLLDMSDISIEAINISKRNSKSLGVNSSLYCGDLLKEFPNNKKYDVIVCNPPYIKDESTVDIQTLKYEPHLALFAKPYTIFYEKIFDYVSSHCKDNFILAFEIGEDMEEDLTNLIKIKFDNINFTFKRDLYGKIRFLYIMK